MTFLSHALGRINPSATVGITQKARNLKAAGQDVIALSAGEPDFDTPQHIKDAAVAAIAAGKTKYTNVDGIPELKSAIVEKFKRDNALDVDMDEAFVATGGKQVIFNALMSTLNAGDEVIVPKPYWVSYPDIVQLMGAKPVFANADASTGFKLTAEELERCITPQTKWLMLNSPSNPSGAAYSFDELAKLAQVLMRHEHVHILSDDIYEKLVYDGSFATIAQVQPELRARTLVLNGVSKSHAMTGWRIGYCAAPKSLVKAMTKLQSQSTTNACSISQWAAVAALNGPEDFLAEWKQQFLARRELVLNGLRQAPGIDCLTPAGAFYVFPSIKELVGKTSKSGVKINTCSDFVMTLLDETGVALVHGEAFGVGGHFRLSYAAAESDLSQAVERIADFSKSLR